MNYFLDTNICIYLLKGKFPEVKQRLEELSPQRIKIVSLVRGELLLGAEKSNNSEETREVIEQFLLPFEIVAFDKEASEQYARIRGELEKKGQVIGPNDLLIAATVCANDGTLVTRNEKEFDRVPGLKVENWTGNGG